MGERRRGPFLWIEGSPVEVWALGEDRFAIRAPGHEQIVTGLEEADKAADALAEQIALEAGSTSFTAGWACTDVTVGL